MEQASMQQVYHVVCHDCAFEGVYETTASAADECERHDADHRVSQLEIERPRRPETEPRR